MNIPAHELNPEDTRLDGLLAAARADRPDTSRAEYGFETRLATRLTVPARSSGLIGWAVWTWRLAPVFAVIALSLSLWTHYAPASAPDDGVLTEWSNSTIDDFGTWLLNDDSPLS